MRSAAVWGAVLTLAWAGVAGAAESGSLRPPGLKPEPSSIEAGLWGEADRGEAFVRKSAETNQDPALNAYVRSVTCRIAADYCGEMRIYVLDRPFLNATAAPNGYVEVWSGLMLRALSEDELAYVLGHEVTHFARNHSLERYRDMKATANVVLALQIGITAGAVVAMANSPTGGVNGQQSIDSIADAARSLNDLVYLAGLAHVYGYSRENESEADRLGYGRSTSAGYAAGAGADLWTFVVAEAKASDFPAVRKAEGRASVFRTHPVTADRVAALAAMGGPPGGLVDRSAQSRYRARIRPFLGAWLKDDLRRRDFGQTLALIDRLETVGEDLGTLEFYRGEVYRLRRKDGDAALAAAAYRSAGAHADAPPAAFRELGEALRRQGDRAGAAAALRTYIERAPDAADRWLVESSLKTLTTTEVQ